MDFTQGQEIRTVDGRPLRFIRCDSTGRELSVSELNGMSFTNDTIKRIVTQASQRFGSDTRDGGFTEGISTL